MNITHRSIWNAALGAWVAVSEITRACGKRSGAAVALVLAGASVCAPVGAQTVIDGGAVVTVPDTQSSPWNISDELWVGEYDHGTLTVSGGTVSNTYGTIAFFSSSTGTATVTGASSVWHNSGTLAVSLRGNGTLTVLDGGTVRDTDGYIGFYDVSTGRAAVTGVNSTWTNNGNLFVGYGGNGTLSVAAGGSVSNTTGVIGYTGIGNATVTGVNSTWSNGVELFVGQWGSGTLTVADGGHVSVNSGVGPIYVANIAGSTGVLNIGAAVGSAAQAAGTIAAGEVQFGAGTGSLNFNHTDTAYTFGTRITGAGTLNHYAGTTILTGANTYTGATTVSGGTLRAGAAGTLSSSSAFTLSNTAGATLDLNNFNQTIGSLSGGGASGGDITLGSGILTTGGNNSSTSYAGVISGSGGVTKQGSGTLTLTGANNYSGGTTVSAGTLQGSTTSLQGNITNNAAIVFDQASSGAYAGAISGAGSLAKTGAGNVNLTGTHTYTGATTISGGTLSVNGSIANSAVTVNSGGTLGGSGTVGSTSITSGGLLAPGNSIGTLTVNGNLNFAAGSIYRVEVDAVGNNDRINVTGTATLNGGTVDVQAGAGTYAANTTYTLLNAAGGRTGNFSGVTSNLAFLTPTLAYDANNVFLSLARNSTSFSAVAITPNQIATSTALQNANAGATGDMSVVQTALTGLSVEQARAAYDSASGAGLVALRNAGANFAAGLGRQLQARLGAVGGASSTQAGAFAGGPILLAANDSVSDLMAPMSDSPQKFSLASGTALPSASSAQGRGFWLRGSGAHQNTRSDGNATASELRNTSLSAGFDAQVNEALVLGAALSSGTARLGFDNTDSGKSRANAIALYGSYASGPWAFKGSASAAWASNQMDRAVMIGAINRTASSDFDSNTLSAYGEATYNLTMNGWTLQPLVGLAFSRNKTDGFTEAGAGALNLQVADQTITSTKSLLGAKASFEAGRVRLEPRVIWAHEFGDLNTPMTAQFQGAPTASPFQVSGVALKRNTLILGLGASGRVGQGVELFADVQAEHNSAQRNLALLGGLRIRW